MASQSADGMIGIGGRWWLFPGARIDTDSWELEWRGDGMLCLHEDTGNVVEGTEMSDGKAKQLSREMQLADVLELAAATLRSGEGWEEGTAGDVLREILHVYREHAKKALGLALLSEKF
jgi:hypothetical protein